MPAAPGRPRQAARATRARTRGCVFLSRLLVCAVQASPARVRARLSRTAAARHDSHHRPAA